MKLLLLLAAAIATAVAVAVWKSQHGVEVWHAAPAAPA
jgi:hypothetical protein